LKREQEEGEEVKKQKEEEGQDFKEDLS